MTGESADVACDERGYIAVDVICLNCGYNLRGLMPDGRCPECGATVRASFRGQLSWADPRWLRRVARGLALLMTCMLLWYAFDWAATRHILSYRDSGKSAEEAVVWFMCMPVLAQTPTLKLTTHAMWLAAIPQLLAVLGVGWAVSVPKGLALAGATRRVRGLALSLKVCGAVLFVTLLVTARSLEHGGFDRVDRRPLFVLMVLQMAADFVAAMLVLSYMPRLLDTLGDGGGRKLLRLAMRLACLALAFSAATTIQNMPAWWWESLTVTGGSHLEHLVFHPVAVLTVICFHLAVLACVVTIAMCRGKLDWAARPTPTIAE